MIKTPTKSDSLLAFVSPSFVLALGVATHMYLVHVHCSFRFFQQERHRRLVESNDALDTNHVRTTLSVRALQTLFAEVFDKQASGEVLLTINSSN